MAPFHVAGCRREEEIRRGQVHRAASAQQSLAWLDLQSLRQSKQNSGVVNSPVFQALLFVRANDKLAASSRPNVTHPSGRFMPEPTSEPTIVARLQSWSIRYCRSFSFVGLVTAALFFAASVTPSLLPRNFIVQGLLSGFALAVGYGVGFASAFLWDFLELPKPGPQRSRTLKKLSVVVVAIIFVCFLRQMTFWQNSIRLLMEMQPVQTAYPYRTALIAVVTAIVLITIARLLQTSFSFVSRQLSRFLPRRVAYAISGAVVGIAFLFLLNDVVAKNLLIVSDRVFQNMDELIEDGVQQPSDAKVCGGPDSLVPWETIGRRGKEFIIGRVSVEQLSEFTSRQATEPIRVYVGLSSADTPKARAQLALAELKRVGGFERSVLVVATPTGTGWLDPNAVNTVEYVHGGDTAIVSMQYSYLPSWLTILVDPNRSRDTARILFDEVYAYWTTLPKKERPRLYVHGLSLGALGAETSADLYKTFEDPIQGAVLSGAPFPSTQWSALTRARNEGSPMWLPKIRDGSMVRFTGQRNSLDEEKRWGPIRCVYIQYASDPMVFFSPDILWQQPEWLSGGRGPDVSTHLTWYPLVTFLQVAFDLPMATSVPLGFGHNYSASNYIDAWVAVTDPQPWTAEDTRRLKELFDE